MMRAFATVGEAAAHVSARGLDQLMVRIAGTVAIVGPTGMEDSTPRIRLITCPSCNKPNQRHYAKGLCKLCYHETKRREKGMKPREHWGKHTHCRKCGKDQIRAQGLCAQCYRRMLEERNVERRRAQKKRARERFAFGGRRAELLALRGGCCELCGITESENLDRYGRRLEIHHKDGNGRTSPTPNHCTDNLIVLCRSCHSKLHTQNGIGKKQGAISC